MNVKPIETVEEYRQALAAHDWWFAMSDDYTSYSQGQRNRDRLLEAAKTFDPDMAIWAEYKPKGGAA
jgi:hypothetical protein